jgi:hypothetical protein
VRALPFAGAAAFAGIARRTGRIRIALAVVVVGLVVATAAAARNPQVRAEPYLPEHTNSGIIVLDLSASVASDTYARIGTTLRAFARSDDRFGLILFSSTAYQALPLGTPSSALRPLIRYFTLPATRRPGESLNYPVNPWTESFTSGTRISTGLDLAHRLAFENGARRTPVILVSDLSDDTGDVPLLNAMLLAYRRDGVPLRVVPLNATDDDKAYFRRLLGAAGEVLPQPAAAEPARASISSVFPRLLAGMAATVVVALCALELWSSRLDWEAEVAR